ncbi:oligomeric Golgi complex subunit 6 [Usnea florida]
MSGIQSFANDISESLDDKLNISSVPQRSTALSNKLSSVLSASYADSEIRDALRSLDEKEIKNTAETRRRLRLDIQKEVIQRNGAIIQEFGHVAEQLKRIGTTIISLNRSCEDMRQQLTAARQENMPVLEEASTLLVQKQELETKKQLLDAFNKHFIISEEDLLILTGVTEAVDENFFTILNRVKQIYADCQVLLGTENQRLGLELMDQSSRNLNAGYQKLYRWIQKEFKTLNLETPQISSRIRRALRALAERPTLFQNCLDSFAEAREHVLTEAFYSALTGSSNEYDHPMTKPIEFYAHEPLRYVGDMLAWTHSATVSEREALESLFISDGEEISKGFQAGRRAEPWSVGDEAFDGRKALGELVNRDVAGIARALRQRIEQVLQNHEDAVLLYKIANLIMFYRITFVKLLGSNSSLLDTLSSLGQSALRQFSTVVSDNVLAIQADVAAPPPDLRIPGFLDEALSQLTILLKTHDSSLTPASSRVADFELVISEALNPFLSICEKMAKQISEPSASVFAANCLLAAKTALSAYDFVQDRVSDLTEQLASLTSNLTEYQHAFFLHTSGLHPLLVALAPIEETMDSLIRVPTLPSFQAQPLTDASQALDDFLPSALMDAMENLKRLENAKLSQEITADAAERFCEDFEFVEGKLTAVDELRENTAHERGAGDEKEEQELVPLRSLFPRTSGEIRVLLS